MFLAMFKGIMKYFLVALMSLPPSSAPDHITAGAYNRNIDKRLARKLVWLRETTITHDQSITYVA